MTYRMGVDIGGTFTDFVLLDDVTGAVTVEKCLTTPRQPEAAVYQGISQMEEKFFGGGQVRSGIIHATTLITNAIIEGKGAKTGLITTKGFRDVLEMGRETRYYVYDLHLQFAKPIVPRALRRPVHERTLVDGSIAEAIDEAEVERVVLDFEAAGVASIAVMFLHAYRNPANELQVREVIRRVAPKMKVSLSHEVVSQPKEYERLSTTVLDAYVKPISQTYMENLDNSLRESGQAQSLSIMMSSGSISPIDVAKNFPIQLVESGPAAGVEAAKYYGDLLGIERVLAFDMGGTTAKLCLIRQGKVGRTREFEVARLQRFRNGSGYPVAVPVYNLLEIGAGGGSIAHLNSLGLLAVGPESAGSEPGPACYGRGGANPTVTDADAVLGFIDPSSFLGGEMALDVAAARTAIDTFVANPLDTTTELAAWGIYDLVTETMASAARLHLAERGEDPSRCTLIASGGAGPVHAVALAKRLDCPAVVIPPMPGVMSAFGLLAARSAFDLARSVRIPLLEADGAELETTFTELEKETRETGRIGDDATLERFVEVRHRGQESAVELEVTGDWREPATIAALLTAFGDEYKNLYGRRGDDTPLEISTIRVVAAYDRTMAPPAQPRAKLESRSSRSVYFSGKLHEHVAVIPRHTLKAGDEITGPAIIEERESTTVVWPDDRARVDACSALVIAIAPR